MNQKKKNIILVGSILIFCFTILCTAGGLFAAYNILDNSGDTSPEGQRKEEVKEEEKVVVEPTKEPEKSKIDKVFYLSFDNYSIGGDIWTMNFDGSVKSQLSVGGDFVQILGFDKYNNFLIVKSQDYSVSTVDLTGKTIAKIDVDYYPNSFTNGINLFVSSDTNGPDQSVEVYSLPDLKKIDQKQLAGSSVDINMNGFIISENGNWLAGQTPPEGSDMMLLDLKNQQKYYLSELSNSNSFGEFVGWKNDEIIFLTFDEARLLNPETKEEKILFRLPVGEYTQTYSHVFFEDNFYYITSTALDRQGSYSYKIMNFNFTTRENIEIKELFPISGRFGVFSSLGTSPEGKTLFYLNEDKIVSINLSDKSELIICDLDCVSPSLGN